MSVALISVHFTPRRVERTLAVAKKLIPALELSELVVVCNDPQALAAVEGSRRRFGIDFELIQHDNSCQEFGACQRGLDHVRGKSDVEWIVFMNDTIGNTSNVTKTWRDLLTSAVSKSISIPTAQGLIYQLNQSYQMHGLRTHRWIRTHYFALNRAAVERLDWKIFADDAKTMITGQAEPDRFFSPTLDPVLRDHVDNYLFGSGPGWHWYGAQPLSPENADRMAAKARAILQEKFLSARLEGVGAQFWDLNWAGRSQKLRSKVADFFFRPSA